MAKRNLDRLALFIIIAFVFAVDIETGCIGMQELASQILMLHDLQNNLVE